MTPDRALEDLARRGFAGWRAEAGRAAIAKRFAFADFDSAFAWMRKVAVVAAAADHHPEWTNVYGRVDVVLTTHDAGGVTDKDIALAAAMEAAAAGS